MCDVDVAACLWYVGPGVCKGPLPSWLECICNTRRHTIVCPVQCGSAEMLLWQAFETAGRRAMMPEAGMSPVRNVLCEKLLICQRHCTWRPTVVSQRLSVARKLAGSRLVVAAARCRSNAWHVYSQGSKFLDLDLAVTPSPLLRSFVFHQMARSRLQLLAKAVKLPPAFAAICYGSRPDMHKASNEI